MTKFWVSKELINGGNIDTLIIHFKNIDELRGNDHYNWYKWQQNRFNELKTMNKNDILYDVVKAFYKVEIFKMKTPVINYYIIRNDKIIGKITENEMRDVVNEQQGRVPLIPLSYEYAQFKFIKPELP